MLTDQVGDRDPVDELHDLEHPVLVDAEVVEHRRARVLQLGQDPRLAGEAVLHLLVAPAGQLEELDGDPAVQVPVVAAVHGTHPALAQRQVVQLVPVGDEHAASPTVLTPWSEVTVHQAAKA